MSEAKTAKDVIYVDVDDEITSIIDKVDNSAHKVVALVLPKRAASLQSIVNMKLLKRSADTAEKNVVLITSERALLPLAGAAGLHVAKNLQSAPEIPEAPTGAAPAKTAAAADTAEELPEEDADEEDMPQKIDYDRPVGALAAKHEAENPETIDLDDEDDKPAKAATATAAAKSKKGLKVPNFDRFRMMLGLGAAALIALIVFIILALFVLPKATVAITTSSEPVTANFNLTASDKATLDAAKGTIPAKLETKDQTGTQQVTATGQQNNGQKATGSVSMTICASSPAQVGNVPAGTGVSTNGLSFITQQTANFSFSGSCSGGTFKFQSNSVNITAVQPGSKFNTSISGASVSNSSATADGSASGGTDNIVTVLSQNDVDNAKAKLTGGTAGDQFSKDFENQLSSTGEYVLTSTLKTTDPVITATPAVGQPASTANVSIKVTYSVLTVRKDDLKQVIQAKLADQVDKSKQKLSDSFMNDANITVQSQSSPTSAVLLVNEDTTAVPIINTTTVKQVSAGKKVGDIKTAINSWPGVKSVDVQLSPFWVSKVPGNQSKIKVVIKEDKSGSDNSAP